MVYMWWIVEWTVVGFGRSDMLYNNYWNSFRKAVFQNCKVIPDDIWCRGNLTGRGELFCEFERIGRKDV